MLYWNNNNNNDNNNRTRGEKENLQILRDIGSWHHQTRGDERKKKLRNNISEELENYSRQKYIT